MPDFNNPPRSAATQIPVFTVQVTVHKEPGQVATVLMAYLFQTTDDAGVTIRQFSGDLRAFLTANQQTNFENAVLALYNKALVEVLPEVIP